VELAPQEANAHQLLGDSYRARGELDRAMAEYREALALDPDFHFATVSLATTLVLRGRLEEAADLLSPLASRVGVIPRHRIDAGFALAHVRRAQGRFNDAAIVLGALEPALKDEGVREAMGLSVRGLSLMAIGESESAASLIEKAIDRSPGVPTRYLFARGLLELSRGDTAAARVTAAAIAEHALPPENPDRTEDKAAAYLRGRAMLRQGDAEGAIRALSRAVELSGYRYRIYRRDLARALLEAGRVEEAATAAREAAESVDLADPRIDLELERRRARLVLAEAERALGRTRSAASRVNDLLSAWSGADEGFAARARAQDMAEQLGDAGRSMAQ
jgi:Flp pilus assembly protein TadD